MRKPISELNILSEQEYNKVIYHFNETAIDYFKDKCIHEVFEEQAQTIPNSTAVIACDRTLTYRELNEEANRIAHSLIERGVKPNDIVAFMLPRRSYLLSVMMGILKTGAAYLPIAPDYPQERINGMLADGNVKMCITEENISDFLSGTDISIPCVRISENNYFCTLHTSGSTGTPKLSLLTHSNIENFVCGSKRFYENVNVSVSATIITFDAFILDTVIPIALGIPVKLCSEDEIYNQIKFEQAFEDVENALFFSTPTKLANYIRNSDNPDFARKISSFVVGGEIFTEELYALIRTYNNNADIFNIYGPTETTICVTTCNS